MKTLSATCLLVTVVSAASGEHVELLNLVRIEGSVRSVTDKHVVVSCDGRDQKIELRDVAEIRLAEAPQAMTKAGQQVLCTLAGDLLAVSDLKMEQGSLSFTTSAFGKVSLPTAAADVVYLPPADQTPEQLRRKRAEMKIEPSAADLLVVAKEDGSWLTVTGLLKAAGAEKITFRWQGEDRKLSRRAVRAILFGRVSFKSPERAGTVTTRYGSVLGFQSIRLEGDSAVIRCGALGERKVSRGRLGAIRFESDRVVRLSELKPSNVREYGVFKTFPHRANRAVGGGPIRLGGRTYTTGLGLHSFCELSYELRKRFDTFVAVVGIDDLVRPNGDAVLTILGDGKELAAPLRLTGEDAPKTVRLDVSKVRVLTVRVDFGEHGLDPGDHVDLADAKLIK